MYTIHLCLRNIQILATFRFFSIKIYSAIEFILKCTHRIFYIPTGVRVMLNITCNAGTVVRMNSVKNSRGSPIT